MGADSGNRFRISHPKEGDMLIWNGREWRNKPTADIGLTTKAYVDTQIAGVSGGSGGALGALVALVAAAGASNDVDPGSGWPTNKGRLDVDTTAGTANFTGLKAGADGQLVLVSNTGTVNNLTLNKANAGSLTANRFAEVDDIVIVPGSSVWICYYAGSVNRWRVIP